MRPATPLVLLFVLSTATCEHGAPFTWAGPDTLGPFGTTMPRRLTFNTLDDRNPSVVGGELAFSRWDGTHGRERCLAFLSAAGGTLHRTVCPPPPRTLADTFVDTWVEPALSPGGAQLAFVWQQGAPASYYTWTRTLVVARANDLGRPTFAWPVWYVLPDGRIATAVSKPIWISSTTIRFLASYERVYKVKGGGSERLTDTAMDAYSLADLSLTAGTVGVVPGADSTIAYAPIATGGTWIVKSADSTRLLFLAPGADSAVSVAVFLGPVVDLADVNGVPVGLRAGGDAVEWIDLTTGTVAQIETVRPIRRIVAVPGTRRFVAEMENSADSLASVGANLWLFALP
jgi:hypothetical protein